VPPQEQACVVQPEVHAPEGWPTRGEIKFTDAKLRYRHDLPLALQGATFAIRAGEHIGVVGRTGSGKSTIMQALFRLVELSAGSVEIDGIATGAVDIRQLRSRMTIIPQDPMLFKGTVRSNLDPFGEQEDEKLQRALREIGMAGRVQLSSAVTENGECFSVGERQLLCLARAMVRDTRIILLDEATANVDAGSDQIMQQVIRKHFATCTTITIAHRLDTIMDSDRILLLDRGTVAEFASPEELLRNPASLFYSMVQLHRQQHNSSSL
jgi:ABC-type multidrug transport system fused ATPase/permease subunit